MFSKAKKVVKLYTGLDNLPTAENDNVHTKSGHSFHAFFRHIIMPRAGKYNDPVT